jgi:Domain of unknown function (DUF222)/HNH endonuclease
MSDHSGIIEYVNGLLKLDDSAVNTVTTAGGDPVPQDDRVPADDPAVLPLERLEARICSLAGHLTAATCQFLLLVADFDAREGWAGWQMPSCAAWLSWKCQVAPGTAREQVRVARALEELPLIRTEFAAGRLSYAKARALTRIATPETEADLVGMATPMTAGQLERFARAHRQASGDGNSGTGPGRRLAWHFQDEHEFAFRGHLPPEAGAVVLQALRAARNDLEHPHDDEPRSGDSGDGGVSAETRPEDGTRLDELNARDKQDGITWDAGMPPGQRTEHAGDLADALVEICAAYLRDKARHADNPDTYQIIIHAGAEAVTEEQTPREGERVSAETPAPAPAPPPAPAPFGRMRHPAYPSRCHLEDGPALSPQTVRLIGCNAAISTMVHDADGNILSVGRRTRKPPPALRRAVRERDGYRCRFPGCESRRTDAHHIRYWSNGGETSLANLLSLCKTHHKTVHAHDIVIAGGKDGFAFYTRDGTPVPASPKLPEASGDIASCHHAVITPATIVSPCSGERLDLNMAIWVCLTNAKIKADRRVQAR